ncbi:hypothetical protein ACOQFL_04525 [Actinopolyspora sp. H202]|uniref:hypothetical protein n=1 Tax=Actinopolyspora sp. H202 TaxID=1500456 RepID=UPI003EE5F073
MSRDSGSGDPSQRTVAELLAEHGGGEQRGSRRRRRRAEDPSETAPQAIIERVNSDSGRMLPVDAPEAEDASPSDNGSPSEHGTASGPEASASFGPTAQPPVTAPPPAAGASPEPPSAPPPQSPAQPPQPDPTVDQQSNPASDESSTPSRRRVSGAGPRRPTRPGARSAEPGAQPDPGDESGKWSTPAAESGAAPPAAATPPATSTPPAAVTPTTAVTPPASPPTNSAPPAEDTETTAQQPPLPVRTPGTSGMSRKAPSGDTPQWQSGTAPASGPDARANPAQDGSSPDTAVPDSPGSEGAVPDAMAPESPARKNSPVREDLTEQFPPVRGGTSAGDPEATDGDGTALLEYPIPAEAESVGAEPTEAERDAPDEPHGTAYFDPYEEMESEFGDSDAFYTGMVDDPYADSDDYAEEDEYSDQPPTGIPAEDYESEREAEQGGRSAVREWVLLVAQTLAGLVGGGLVWIGFRWLWSELPLPALAAALAFTGTLVLIARKVLRTDDLQTILLSVLVGLVCTVSPVAFLLLGY